MTWTATTLSILDGAGASHTVVAYTDGTNFSFPHSILDNAGTIISPATSGAQTTANTSLAAIQGSLAGTLSVSGVANITGGASTFYNAAQSNSVTAVKASAGNLYGFSFYNPNTSIVYVQFFDLATGSITLGTTGAKNVYAIPANGYGEEKFTEAAKIAYTTAITIAVTTTVGGSIAPSAGILTNIIYK